MSTGPTSKISVSLFGWHVRGQWSHKDVRELAGIPSHEQNPNLDGTVGLAEIKWC